MSVLTTLMLIIALVFGGSGAAYAAAQDSLPDQPLYGLKVAGEELQIQLTAQEQSRLELVLKFSLRRVNEMEKMAQAGQEIPASVQARWQQQVQEAVQLAANMPEEGARLQAMLQVHEQLQNQAQLMNQAGDVPMMEQARQMVQDRIRQVEQIMAGFGPGGKPEDTSPGNQGNGPGEPQGGANPFAGENNPQGGSNPWTTGTPTPGSSYGPGPGTCDTCTPQGTPQGGNNPYTTGTPTPGSSYGPGPGTCENCTPQGGSNPGMSDTSTPGSGNGPGSGSGTNTTTGQQGKH